METDGVNSLPRQSSCGAGEFKRYLYVLRLLKMVVALESNAFLKASPFAPRCPGGWSALARWALLVWGGSGRV